MLFGHFHAEISSFPQADNFLDSKGKRRKTLQHCAFDDKVVRSAVLLESLRGPGGGGELRNLSYRDRAAYDQGHRDVTSSLAREV